jgi:cytoskeletal protein CcmA (bactofilin family)
MTVQELINELEKVKNKNLKVVIQGMDPTDWVYNNEVVDIGEQNVYDGEIGYRRRFVIDGGMF